MQKFSLLEHFSVLPDPRRAGHSHTQHVLLDIIIVAVLAVICGADSWVEIEEFGIQKEEWLRKFLRLTNGIPSHDTFGRIFSILDPDAFESCFLEWVQAVRKATNGEVVAIDGKSLRRSHAKGERPLHLVNAFAAENSLVLGQQKVDGKTNEITAIPELLKRLQLNGCIVTTDAMGTQCWIAKKILENKGDYALAVKGNQARLMEDIVQLFAAQKADLAAAPFSTLETSHGREEKRECWVSDALDGIRDRARWDGLKNVAKVTCTRTINGKTSAETRYFISSLAPDAEEMLRVVRAHWAVENSLHWSLDISFREDESRVRMGYAGQNLALVRKLALNLLRKEKTAKGGVKARRLRAGWSDAYLCTVLGIDGEVNA